jgi:hypothetical protein
MRPILATLATTLAALAASLVLASTPALAGNAAHIYLSSITGSGASTLSEPTSVAVSTATGDVYVLDRGHSRIERFSSTGEYLGQFNGSGTFEVVVEGKAKVETGAAAPTGAFSFITGEFGELPPVSGVAVDNSTSPLDPSAGDVYVSDTGHRVIDKFSATGAYLGQITKGAGGAPFEYFNGVAVDPEGKVWVAQADEQEQMKIDNYSDALANGFISSLTVSEISATPGFAVDSEGNFYTSTGFETLEELNSFGEQVNKGYKVEKAVMSGVAVDLSNNDVYVDNCSGYEAKPCGKAVGVYSTKSGSPIELESFGSGHLAGAGGVAVNYSKGSAASGLVYVADSAGNDVAVFETIAEPEVAVEPVSSLTAGSITVKGTVDPRGTSVTDCELEYGTEPGAYPEKAPCMPEVSAGKPLTGAAPVAVSATATGLTQGETYYYRLSATDATDTYPSEGLSFFLPDTVAIEGESTSSVGSTEARLEAQIDPGGSATAYHFEYGPVGSNPTYDASIPVSAGEIGATLTGVSVSAVATGLTPSIAYNYRVVASNALPGEVHGPKETFTTLTPVGTGSPPPGGCPNEQLRAEQPYGLELPDCRAYEMVSPLEKNDSNAATDNRIEARSSVSGEAIAYISVGAFGESAGSYLKDTYISSRGPDGWSTRNITPAAQPSTTTEGAAFWAPFYEMAFTPDLSKGIVTHASAQLSSEAPNGFEEMYLTDFSEGSYQLVSKVPGTTEGIRDSIGSHPGLAGASTDLTHIVYNELEIAVIPRQLDEWVNGRIFLVNVKNNGEALVAAAGSGEASGRLLSDSEAWHAVSSDGSRIYMTSGEEIGDEHELYLRENPERPQSPVAGGHCTVPADACTIDVSASQRSEPDPHGPSPVFFRGASADGAKAFFTSSAELTDDANTGPADNAPNLYEYDVERPEGERLKDLTVDTNVGDPDGADVVGVMQISEEGSYVYFVAEGVLAAGATSGQANLYMSYEGGAPTFIATLEKGELRGTVGETDGGDSKSWFKGPSAESRSAVNGDGTHLIFDSERRLTSYDNEQAEPGDCGFQTPEDGERPGGGPCTEVYLYDATTQSLTCVSCNPSGARPIGKSELNTIEASREDFRLNSISEDGERVFFDSADALVPHDSNGRRNVYEYENGHVYPISNVAGNEESFFLAASPSGNDVFIGTADQLVPQDTDHYVDVYDVRIDGGFPVSVPPPTCNNGDSCKGPESPQPSVFGAPASATFSGAGNITPEVAPPPKKLIKKTVTCKKGDIKNHKGKCVPKKKKAKKAKRASRNRRGNS